MSNGAIVLGRERDLLPLFQGRTEELQRRMADEGIDLVLLTNVDSIYYYTAYWGDLGLEFGRPTMVAVAAGGEVTLITAESESLMARAMTWVEDLETFSDGVGNEWRDPLDKVLGSRAGRIALAVERTDIPAVISDYLRSGLGHFRARRRNPGHRADAHGQERGGTRHDPPGGGPGGRRHGQGRAAR